MGTTATDGLCVCGQELGVGASIGAQAATWGNDKLHK